MKKFVSIFKTNAFKITLMIGLFITSALIILAMLLGNASGNFVIQVEDGSADKSIAITDDLESPVYVSKIVTEGAAGMTCTNPASFLESKDPVKQQQKVIEYASTSGRTYTTETVYIYTFYIVNTGNQACNIDINLDISNIVGDIDKAIRIMTYNPASQSNQGQLRIYQAKDDIPTDYLYPVTPIIFEDDRRIFSQQEFLSAGTAENPYYIPYTIFMWLDGDDPEADERLYLSSIKFALEIAVNNG